MTARMVAASVLPPVERASRERLEEANPQREDVEPMVGLTRCALLGRHVGELALDHSGLGLVRTVVRLGDSEIEQLHRTGVSNHDVVRRHIAVNDVERLTVLVVRDVRVVERARHIDTDANRDWKPHSAGLARLPNHPAQRHSVDPLHHDEVRPFVRAELMELA